MHAKQKSFKVSTKLWIYLILYFIIYIINNNELVMLSRRVKISPSPRTPAPANHNLPGKAGDISYK